MEQFPIVIYNSPDGSASFEVKLKGDTVWLSQAQMTDLFARNRTVITKHINNVFKEKELAKESNVHFLHIPNSDKPVAFYSLDVIISVGYRVKSQRGTQFRVWANKIIKEYLIKGYVVKQQLESRQLADLKKAIKLIGDTAKNKKLTSDEAGGMLQILQEYSYGLDILDRYDYGTLSFRSAKSEGKFKITYPKAIEQIKLIKSKFGGGALFGKEKDNSFKSSVATIYQTFDSKELYISTEEKAAMLLYLVVKNHSFVDGNKRIAACMFLWFMEENGILYNKDGQPRIDNNTLVALTLMIAQSPAREKDTMFKVIVNLISKKN